MFCLILHFFILAAAFLTLALLEPLSSNRARTNERRPQHPSILYTRPRRSDPLLLLYNRLCQVVAHDCRPDPSNAMRQRRVCFNVTLTGRQVRISSLKHAIRHIHSQIDQDGSRLQHISVERLETQVRARNYNVGRSRVRSEVGDIRWANGHSGTLAMKDGNYGLGKDVRVASNENFNTLKRITAFGIEETLTKDLN
mmetsp:Transcript_4458/g.9579  ORF Transcript_4458/g.9579 Transcript_4458/m.9579 type:complete len:197 (+) Transcript_4458:65-655(+)